MTKLLVITIAVVTSVFLHAPFKHHPVLAININDLKAGRLAGLVIVKPCIPRGTVLVLGRGEGYCK